MAKPYGGYEFKFVDGDPPSRYICAICTLVSCDPQQVTCCYNTFCKTCLEQLGLSVKQPKCPLCQEELSFFNDGKLNHEITALKIHCTNSEEGCEWQGTINETGTSIDTHLNSSCIYHLVPCTNECGEKIRRSTLETHLTDNCTQRIVNCQYCKRKGRYQLITSNSHLDECPDLPIQCSNEGCNEKILRRSLASHNETCPKAIIPCEYNTVGCEKRMKREEQEKHNEESSLLHLQLTKEELVLTEEQLQLTDQQLKEATETIQSLKSKVQEHENLLTTSSEVLKFSQCSQRKEGWHSRGFYTSPGGYKMSLHVYPNGNGDGKGTHFSCFISLLGGEYDDILEWPFQGEVTVELLNQLEDKNHWKEVVHYTEATPDECKQRVSKGQESKEWGYHKFLSHAYRSTNNQRFLKNDSLYFRVSVKATSKTKPWLH
ncbi:PREDICTED: TNF receptor-associated factor 4-like [Amphimedon queenslandica]|uniref:RING-type E3 ubiquitin transferase n=1 Tax=Amphimedon queenslandica TaxID=400682 RepID=A0A1X7TIC7_AMPQE|nr:PREDICTED: TNF receptor-associated factor 4-like [Amphimedon queenslandica]|eukprot:XP_011407491.1 PREDICTED: TNF receptor-associated factor 4-like [Amphimedon queenslandica]